VRDSIKATVIGLVGVTALGGIFAIGGVNTDAKSDWEPTPISKTKGPSLQERVDAVTITPCGTTCNELVPEDYPGQYAEEDYRGPGTAGNDFHHGEDDYQEIPIFSN